MGYNTAYSLEVKSRNGEDSDQKTVEALIDEFRNDSEEAGWCLDSDGSCFESAKWYGHDIDLLTFSEKHPEWIFVLKGEGEESGDIWKKYFCAGKVQIAKARIEFDEFDEEKLCSRARRRTVEMR